MTSTVNNSILEQTYEVDANFKSIALSYFHPDALHSSTGFVRISCALDMLIRQVSIVFGFIIFLLYILIHSLVMRSNTILEPVTCTDQINVIFF